MSIFRSLSPERILQGKLTGYGVGKKIRRPSKSVQKGRETCLICGGHIFIKKGVVGGEWGVCGGCWSARKLLPIHGKKRGKLSGL